MGELRLEGVTTFHDDELAVADAAAAQWDLPGALTTAAPWDKLEQRRTLARAGLRQPRAAAVDSPEDLSAAVETLGLPGALKPRRGTGSVGVALLSTVDDVRAQASLRDGWHGLLYETLIAPGSHPSGVAWLGDYVSVETVSTADSHHHLAVFDKVPVSITPAPGSSPRHAVRETGDLLPTRLPQAARVEALAVTSSALDALGVRQRATHTELRVSDRGLEVIEVNGRLGGEVARMLRMLDGPDVTRAVLTVALGGRPSLAAGWRAGAVATLYVPFPVRGGVVLGGASRADLRALSGVAAVDEVAARGAPRADTAYRAAKLTLAAADPAALDAEIAGVLDRIAGWYAADGLDTDPWTRGVRDRIGGARGARSAQGARSAPPPAGPRAEPATLWEWFEAAAHRHADLVAVEVDDAALTYAELRAAALDVSARLGGTAARGRRIALCAERGPTAYAAYLGVLHAGGAVVPLDPVQPVERAAGLARAARCDLALAGGAGGALGAALAALGWTVLDLERGGPPGGPPAGGPGAPDPGPDGLAYILFTSGSTGRPKGVPVADRSVIAYLRHAIPLYELGPGARVSQTFELTFDPSVHDLFATWASGATLVAPRRRELLDPTRYAERAGLTHWFSVPSVIGLAQRSGLLRPGSMPGLRCSAFMGEQLLRGQAAAWRAAAPRSALHNAYGPTEATINCAGYRLADDPEAWPRTSNDTVPIGRLYPGVEGVVIDAAGQPGTCGELCVGGAQVFSGYLDPHDDAGRFTTGEGGRRWYRTGDRVAVEGGELVHLGRLDRQLKLHGYRIEPGEVETALRRHPGIREAAVVLSRDGGELCAAYTGERLATPDLARHLRSGLPDYMVPTSFTWVDALPLGGTGKVDYARIREAL